MRGGGLSLLALLTAAALVVCGCSSDGSIRETSTIPLEQDPDLAAPPDPGKPHSAAVRQEPPPDPTTIEPPEQLSESDQSEAGVTSDRKQADSGQDSTKELSQKTTDPTSDIALVFTQFGVTLNDGDLNEGDDKVAGSIVFQPIVPIPLYGTDDDEWRIVSRPTISLFAEQPIPQVEIDGIDFDRKTGLSDLNLPLPLAIPKSMAGRWLLALGPDFSLPTATQDEFGRDQWSAGVTGIIGYQSENWIAGAFPQYYWGISDAGRDDKENYASFGNMFYWFWYNLSDSLQVGFSPTITYDHEADSGNKWNVPVGLGFSKMVNIGSTPLRIEVAAEYSVVHEDDFGQRMLFKVNLIPVIPRPINKPLFGGG